MNILAIETSCDETGIALVEGVQTGERNYSFTVHQAALLSQAALHAAYGGVYPNLAKREHQKNLPVLFEPFADKKESVDAIAVTNGPGLEPALWTGITFAQALAEGWGKPLLPANHMEGHLLSSLVSFKGPQGELKDVSLPILALLISGGHTEFVLMQHWLKYELIGQTLDDAVGECFDKVARMLALPYPGGPEISKRAATARSGGIVVMRPLNDLQHGNNATAGAFKLPRPMIHEKNCDMSFSGLKTAALYALRDRGGIQALSQDDVATFAREFEDAVADVLVAKTRRALTETGAKTFVIGGGVAANAHIRERLGSLVAEEFPDTQFRLPEISITGDNAIMIAIASLVRSLSGAQEVPNPASIRAQGRLSISPAK